MSQVALITGITGQDGSYLTELLLAKGYTVHGLIRRASTFHTERIDHLYQDPHDPATRLFLHYGDLADSSQLTNFFYEVRPDEVYHLGAQSHVRVSFDMPDYTGDITGLGTVRLLEAIRKSGVGVASTRPQAVRCLAMRLRRRANTLHSGPGARTPPPRCMLTGWCGTTERGTGYSRATASCSTMSRPGEGRRL